MSCSQTINVRIDGINYELDTMKKNATVVKSDKKYAGDIIIPSTVTDDDIEFVVECIDCYAFMGCEGLTSINIPDSVTNIGKSAFEGCTGLISINISDSVTSIGSFAFKGCSGLKSINIPNSVTSIEYSTFRGCSSLESINIPDSVTRIEAGAFKGCSSLASINIPDSVTNIGESAFEGCTGLTSINIPDSVTSIDDCAFEGCDSVTSISMGKNVTKDAFSQSMLKLLREETWTDEYGVVFSADKTVLYEAPMGLKKYVIPDGTKIIGQYAFSKTSETLECVLFPDSVEIIENFAFSPIGGQWKKMKSLKIPNSIKTIGEKAFQNTKELKYKGDASGYPWGAEVVIDDKIHYVRENGPRHGCYMYIGEMMNGVPHGEGGYYDRFGGTPYEEGTYYKGELVNGDRWTRTGEKYTVSGDTWNGYGTGVDSKGNVYTGKWVYGYTEEEFDELWHEIN